MNTTATSTTKAPATAASSETDREHLLHIYLRDHEAAAGGGLQLFRRSTKSNRGTAYEAELRRLTGDVNSARDTLRDICRRFDVSFSKVGEALACFGVTLGWLKTNGRAFTYSPLSRVIELEALSAGVKTQLRLWESLLIVADTDPRLDKAELTLREAAANDQLETLGRLHAMAVEEAFVQPIGSTS